MINLLAVLLIFSLVTLGTGTVTVSMDFYTENEELKEGVSLDTGSWQSATLLLPNDITSASVGQSKGNVSASIEYRNPFETIRESFVSQNRFTEFGNSIKNGVYKYQICSIGIAR